MQVVVFSCSIIVCNRDFEQCDHYTQSIYDGDAMRLYTVYRIQNNLGAPDTISLTVQFTVQKT